MKFLFHACVCLFLSSPLVAQLASDPLAKLKAGNKRFFSNDLAGPRRSASIRKGQVGTQTPFCAILACADSRVPPEILFDQGIGDLFVVRVAGNVASDTVIESLDFAVDALSVPLIVVMGHQNCGAVSAVLNHTGDKELGTIASMIMPSTRDKTSLKEAIIANVKAQVETLKEKPLLRQVNIVPAYYDFETGIVEFLNP